MGKIFTTLNGAITATDTTIAVIDGSILPLDIGFKAQIEDEIIYVPANASNSLTTVSRGIDGTEAAAHATGEEIFLIVDDTLQYNHIKHTEDIASGHLKTASGSTYYDQPDNLVIQERSDDKTIRAWVNSDSMWDRLIRSSEFAADFAALLENPPTEDEATKAPTSEWAFDHDAATTGVHGAGANTILYSDHNASMASQHGIDANGWNGQNFLNLFINGSFETGDPPSGWTLAGAGATAARSAAQKKYGANSVALTRGGANATFYQTIPNYADYASKIVTMTCWCYATVASRARLIIYDGVGSTTSSYHTGGSTWELLTVTRTVNASPTTLYGGVQVVTGDTTAYFDGAVFVQGSIAPAFQPQQSAMSSFAISSTRDMTAASGDVAYTGTGFKPRAIHAITAVPDSTKQSKGFCDFALNEYCVYDNGGNTAVATSLAVCGIATVNQTLDVKSLDVDGFTGTWTKTGATAAGTATLYFLCLR